MTELQLYKWIKDNNIQFHYFGDFSELWVFPSLIQLEEFFKIATCSLFNDGGIECRLKQNYIAFDLIPIAEYFNIEIENVIPKTEENR